MGFIAHASVYSAAFSDPLPSIPPLSPAANAVGVQESAFPFSLAHVVPDEADEVHGPVTVILQYRSVPCMTLPLRFSFPDWCRYDQQLIPRPRTAALPPTLHPSLGPSLIPKVNKELSLIAVHHAHAHVFNTFAGDMLRSRMR
jgi:hypothetical protein